MSLARIFSSIACTKFKCFARILPNVLPRNSYLKKSEGGGGAAAS